MHLFCLLAALSYVSAQGPPRRPEPCAGHAEKACGAHKCCGEAADIDAKVVGVKEERSCCGVSLTLKVSVGSGEYDVPLGAVEGMVFAKGDKIAIRGSICRHGGKINAVAVTKDGVTIVPDLDGCTDECEKQALPH